MERLSYQTLKKMGYPGYLLPDAPERVLQFGEGNFLRGFAEDFIDRMNERAGFLGKVVAVQPRPPRDAGPDTAAALGEQEGLYTLCLRGVEAGEERSETRIISCLGRCLNAYRDFEALMACAANPLLRFIISNTTEAGIRYDPACRLEDAPAGSYPGKLTQFLYRRFQIFGNVPGKGFILLPCELIEHNGAALKDCVLAYARQWKLGDGFIRWLGEENLFCSTLVDRIVTGYPEAEAQRMDVQNGYTDRALDTGELYASWVIEGPAWLQEELPFARAALPVVLTEDLAPYRERKVRLLNGAHSAMTAGAYLAGCTSVGECMEHPAVRAFVEQALFEELQPSLDEWERTRGISALNSSGAFARAVLERFSNPHIVHRLASIAMNYTAKWKTRILPAVKDYTAARGQVPYCLTASFAFYLEFYRGIKACPVSDEPEVLNFFAEHRKDPPRELAVAACRQTVFWGEDLTEIPGFADTAAAFLELLWDRGAEALMAFVREKTNVKTEKERSLR